MSDFCISLRYNYLQTNIHKMSKSKTKATIAEELHKKENIGIDDAKRLVNSVVDIIAENLIGGYAVQIRGLFSLKIKTAKARKARNIKDNSSMIIPERKIVSAKFSDDLLHKLRRNG